MRKGYWSQLLSILLLFVVVAAVFFLVWRFYDSLLGTNRDPPPDMQVEDVMQSLSDMLEGKLRARYQELESRLAGLQDLLAEGDLRPAQRDQYASELKSAELELMETQAELEQIQLQSMLGDMQPPPDAAAPDAGREEAGGSEQPDLDGELLAAQKRVIRLSAANAQLEERIRRLSSLSAQREARADQLTGGNVRLEQRIGSQQQQIAALQGEIAELQEEITARQEQIDELEEAAGSETSRSAEVSAQAEQRVQELEDRIDRLQQQLAELRNGSQAASQQLSLASAENRVLYERSDINGLFYTGPEGIRVSLNPDRRARVLQVGTYNVYTSAADGRRQSTRVLIFEEAGEIRFRVYPGFQQPQAGEWF